MKLILVMVTSLDGRSTKGTVSDTHVWTSPEDQKHFLTIRDNASLLIMGSKTYEAVKKSMTHAPEKLRVVITRNPEKYASEKIPGKLEFSSEDPRDLIERLEKKGYIEGYLVGGAHTNTEFIKQGLVTELWQTLEPKILGVGNGIIGEELSESSWKLLSYEKLNETGTLLLKNKFLE